jgi:aspartate racemase
MDEPCIVILGGVGPMAGVALHRHLVASADFARTDQQHPDVIHVSYAGWIPDRTEYLAGREARNPGICAAEVILPFIEMLRNQQRQYLLVIPCATFHATAILEPFFEQAGNDVREHFVSMTECTAAKALQVSNSKRIGVLATTESQLARVWSAPIEKFGGLACDLSSTLQEGVHEAIYNKEYGIKANAEGAPEAVAALHSALDQFLGQAVNTVILGCTEIPLVADALRRNGLILTDPLTEFTRAALNADR